MKYRDHDLSLSASRIRSSNTNKPTTQLEMCSIDKVLSSTVTSNNHQSKSTNYINNNNHLIVTHNNNTINGNNHGQLPLSLDEDETEKLKSKLTKLSKSAKSLDSMSEEGIGSTDGEIVSCCSSLSCSSTSVAGIETGSSFGYGSLQASSVSPSPRSVTPSSRPESRTELVSNYGSRKSYHVTSEGISTGHIDKGGGRIVENDTTVILCGTGSDDDDDDDVDDGVSSQGDRVESKPVEKVSKGKQETGKCFPSTSTASSSNITDKWESNKVSSPSDHDNQYWTRQRPKVNISKTNEIFNGILAQPLCSLEKDLILCPGSRIPLRRYTSELNLSSSVSGFLTCSTSFQQSTVSPLSLSSRTDYDYLGNPRLSSRLLSQSKQSLSSLASSSSPCCSSAASTSSSSSPSPLPTTSSLSFPSTSSYSHHHSSSSSSFANRRRNSDLDLDQLGRFNDGWLDARTEEAFKLLSKNKLKNNNNKKVGKSSSSSSSASSSSSSTTSSSSSSFYTDHHSDDGYSSSSSPGGSFGRESGSKSLYELKKLRQRKRKNRILWSPTTRSRLLIQRIKLSNPISVAMQLTTIDKDLYLHIKPTEMSALVLGRLKRFDSDDLNGIRTLLEFSDQVKKLVCQVINRETSSESQARKIAAFIEVACVLRKLRNWHSLEVIIKALQSPSVYFLEMAWLQTKEQFPIHFSDFLRLCSLVDLCDNYILRMPTNRPSIPNFKNLIHFFQIQCSAKIDLCENKPKWVEPPSIAGWLNDELVEDIRASIGLATIGDSDSDGLVEASLEPGKTSLIPGNEPVRFIVPSTLPSPWINREPRSLSSSHRKSVTLFLLSAFVEEVENIRRYKMRKSSP
ncbi:serine-rich adhesin for platelets-like [Panonychus citri]|uniref:serine-rich adhesin for platelets-like n=1 Tax=Panonychus citri TaxID=50023 RepID=UPI002307A06F|nr:serine-rich adhesin for platelets-like [Panonychus citri]XP_053214356.1 serine-rich adhesin for platelets-like [Panonychus citri]XP_053214358.1 serine-rich adhesin for platelets-like [Panonychus citri]XP_053214359.1 serine-rich adhesin for platelets-like [Panonychus citri]